MVFSRYLWTIISLALAMVLTATALGFYLSRPGYGFSSSVFALMLAGETALLIRYLTRTRRDLLRLVEALKNGDTSQRFNRDNRDPYFSSIHHSFNEIIRDFKLIRLDREAEQQFFEATVDHIRFGILAFNEKGNIRLVNRSFRDLFGISSLERLEILDNVYPGLSGWIKDLDEDSESLRKLSMHGFSHNLIFLVSRMQIRDEEITLLSVRDISREMDRNELEAWQKLLRILRHEILNSVTPIKLMSSGLTRLLEEGRESLPELKEGLETINRRAKGLSEFMDAYSNLYRIPELKLEGINAAAFLNGIRALFEEQLRREGIRCRISCKDTQEDFRMDEKMIEQVIINLVRNAIEALEGTPGGEIILESGEKGNAPMLLVRDNGKGIPSDQLEHIFMPFYSTRTEGSGVGLSFAQHVMKLHGGRIHVRSEPGRGSEFQLIFPGK